MQLSNLVEIERKKKCEKNKEKRKRGFGASASCCSKSYPTKFGGRMLYAPSNDTAKMVPVNKIHITAGPIPGEMQYKQKQFKYNDQEKNKNERR